MGAEPCKVCDRAECRRDEPMTQEHRDALNRVLEAKGRGEEADREFVIAQSEIRFQRAEECRKNRVDWRAEALRLRSELDTALRGWRSDREADRAALAHARATCDGSCDIALARRQVGPDAIVPGSAKECAELWEQEASRLRRARDAQRDSYERMLASYAEQWEATAKERDAARTALALAEEHVAVLVAERDAAVREADRWRHGMPIEGDYVCPDSLRADAAEAEAKTWHESDAIGWAEVSRLTALLAAEKRTVSAAEVIVMAADLIRVIRDEKYGVTKAIRGHLEKLGLAVVDEPDAYRSRTKETT